MYILQSFMRSETFGPRPTKARRLTDKTNFFLPSSSSTSASAGARPPTLKAKAAPTVALTTGAEQSFVPFPGSSEDEEMATSSSCQTENALKRPAPPSAAPEAGRRKRCTTTAASTVHGPAPRRRSIAIASPRPRPAAAAPPVVVAPVAKRAKKSKRAVADMQFAADVHRSIIASLRSREAAQMAIEGAQDPDRELAERLLRGLREQGCSPALFDEQETRQVEADRDSDVAMADDAAEPELAAPAASLSSSPPSPPRTPSPPAQAPADGQRVYALPQLVAIMHIRRHERAAKSRPPARKARVSSPLAAVALTSA